MKTKFTLLALLLITKIQYSQQLIINEVSQGPSGTKEYVELLVVGSPTCNSIPTMDLRNYIIDDNNGNHASGSGTGIAPGCVRFKNIAFWQSIPYGTLILIYNDADVNALVPATDLSIADGNCRLVIPISDCSLLERHTTLPTTGSPTYPSSGYTTCGDWGTVAMSNSDDSFQTISPLGVMLHSVSWGNNTVSPIIYFAGTASAKVALMTNSTDNNPANQLNWIMAAAPANETPGSPNNAANAAWISTMNNSCLPILPLSVSISVSNASCNCNGSATLSASGAIAPFTYTWFPSGGSNNVANGLCPNTYTVSYTSSNGCLESQTLAISSLVDPIQFELRNDTSICEGASLDLNVKSTSVIQSYLWSTASTNSFITVSSANKYWVTVSNQCGSMTDTVELKILSKPVINLGNDTINCGKSEIILSVSNDYTNYLWSNGSEQSSIIVSDEGVFWVKVANECGFVIDTIHIESCGIEIPNVLTINGDGVNEMFKIKNLKPGGDLQILNRWGNTIYESKNYNNDWSPKSISNGTYYYIFNYPVDKKKYTGFITIFGDN
jgi:gliding motility-associated-like protein